MIICIENDLDEGARRGARSARFARGAGKMLRLMPTVEASSGMRVVLIIGQTRIASPDGIVQARRAS